MKRRAVATRGDSLAQLVRCPPNTFSERVARHASPNSRERTLHTIYGKWRPLRPLHSEGVWGYASAGGRQAAPGVWGYAKSALAVANHTPTPRETKSRPASASHSPIDEMQFR